MTENLKSIKNKILKAIHPIDTIKSTMIPCGDRTNAGRKLPEYYLVYFLLVNLLDFKCLGRSEKTAWSIPIVYKKKCFVIEHRKFGIGIFIQNAKEYEKEAEEIVVLIKNGVKLAAPFFKSLANDALKGSNLNINNKNFDLFDKYSFFLNEYQKIKIDITKCSVKSINLKTLNEPSTNFNQSLLLKRQASYMASATIESFYSWTEYIFVQISILKCKISTGIEVSQLANEDWKTKFKTALDLNDVKTKSFYDQLLKIRSQIRNFAAHGAFGKEGASFKFHSPAGAVPVILTQDVTDTHFKSSGDLSFSDEKAIKVIQDFIKYLWADKRQPLKLYIVDSELPTILSMAKDKSYLDAIQSSEKMTSLIDFLSFHFDRSANMDW